MAPSLPAPIVTNPHFRVIHRRSLASARLSDAIQKNVSFAIAVYTPVGSQPLSQEDVDAWREQVDESEGLLIDLNTASARALTRLPGIDRLTAESILARRRIAGSFARLDQLGEVGTEATRPYRSPPPAKSPQGTADPIPPPVANNAGHRPGIRPRASPCLPSNHPRAKRRGGHRGHRA